MTSRIQLVCFDLGGVLIRICRSWREACEAAGLEVRGAWKHGDAATDQQRELGVQFGTGCIDCVTWAARLSDSLHGLYTAEEIIAIHDRFLIEEYPGVVQTIDRIHARGLKTAALSNTNERHWQALVDYPAIRKLQYPTASHILGHYKPQPTIYRAFENQVQHQAAEILFFDDLPENIAAAKQIGWHAELIDPHSSTDVQINAALERHGLPLHDSVDLN